MPCHLRVLHVVDSLGAGGMENGVTNVARELAPRGIETHVACLREGGAFAARLPQPELVYPLGKTSGFSPALIARLARLTLTLRPHLVHTHNLGPLIYAAGATLGGRCAPLLHGEHSQLTPEELAPRRLRQRRWLYRTCRAVHLVSPGIGRELRQLGFPEGKLQVIPNGVDTRRFSPGDREAARAALGLPAGCFAVGMLGRFGPFKRHDLLLEAFSLLAPHWPALHLVLAGAGGSEEAGISARARAHPHAGRIHLLGLQEEPAAFLRALDLLAVPSVNEGFSNAALEAMACGLPVLGQTGCGHEEIFQPGEEGLLADLRTPADLAACLTEVRGDPARLARLGRRARARAVGHFSLAAMADAYEALYRRLAR